MKELIKVQILGNRSFAISYKLFFPQNTVRVSRSVGRIIVNEVWDAFDAKVSLGNYLNFLYPEDNITIEMYTCNEVIN